MSSICSKRKPKSLIIYLLSINANLNGLPPSQETNQPNQNNTNPQSSNDNNHPSSSKASNEPIPNDTSTPQSQNLLPLQPPPIKYSVINGNPVLVVSRLHYSDGIGWTVDIPNVNETWPYALMTNLESLPKEFKLSITGTIFVYAKQKLETAETSFKAIIPRTYRCDVTFLFSWEYISI